MRLRVYIDTSVIGGCFDDEFEATSKKLIDKFINGDMIALISELTELELKGAPKEVLELFEKIGEENVEYLKLTEEAFNLAQKYISEGVIGMSKLVDAEHIALATMNHADVLVSWNFRHIVNLQKIRGYNSVNLKYGYPLLDIRTPPEVISYEE